MADYKDLYLTLFRATEKAIRTLVAAQQECEERFLEASQENLTAFPTPSNVPTEEET